jgi:hypothetical protein
MGSKSKAANHKIGSREKRTNKEQGIAKWEKLAKQANLSPEFRAQIERNLREKR